MTTDFGLADPYVAVMKGVILSIAPSTHIVDISHQVPAQDVEQAAFVLHAAIPYFPPGTIHVVVVDPGVGSERRPIAIRTRDAVFVGPDNGLFSFVLTPEQPLSAAAAASATGGQSVVEVIHLNKPEYWLPHISHTFHGRDIFAPVAAHLAAGVPFASLGTPIDDPWIRPQLQPVVSPEGHIRGRIVHVDRFGNLISNIPAGWLSGQHWRFHIAGQKVKGLSKTYAAVKPGHLLALIGGSGRLEIAVRNGSAAQQLNAHPGEPIEAQPVRS